MVFYIGKHDDQEKHIHAVPLSIIRQISRSRFHHSTRRGHDSHFFLRKVIVLSSRERERACRLPPKLTRSYGIERDGRKDFALSLSIACAASPRLAVIPQRVVRDSVTRVNDQNRVKFAA